MAKRKPRALLIEFGGQADTPSAVAQALRDAALFVAEGLRHGSNVAQNDADWKFKVSRNPEYTPRREEKP